MKTTHNYRIYDNTGSGITRDIDANGLEDAIEQGREWMLGGEWGDYNGTLDASVRQIVRDDDGNIDDAATLCMDDHDCSATIDPREPDCEDDDGHDWQSPHDVVGGNSENPGCFGSGHGSVRVIECCCRCGKIRTTDYGATDHRGQQCTRVTFGDPTEAA